MGAQLSEAVRKRSSDALASAHHRVKIEAALRSNTPLPSATISRHNISRDFFKLRTALEYSREDREQKVFVFMFEDPRNGWRRFQVAPLDEFWLRYRYAHNY